MLERLLKWGRRADVQAKMPGAAENFKPAEDPFNKTPDWLGTLAGLLEECARSTATASVLPRTSERAKGGKELQARLAAEERHCSPYISPVSLLYLRHLSPGAPRGGGGAPEHRAR